MFERVLLPAPFSPSRAWTSPTPASKSTPSFATTPGKRFTIPRIATAAPEGAAAAGGVTCCSVEGFVLRLARRRPDDALDEPVHAVERVRSALQHLHLHAACDADLAALVAQRPGELVVGAVLDRLLL